MSSINNKEVRRLLKQAAEAELAAARANVAPTLLAVYAFNDFVNCQFAPNAMPSQHELANLDAHRGKRVLVQVFSTHTGLVLVPDDDSTPETTVTEEPA
jgi:hypothetical protein